MLQHLALRRDRSPGHGFPYDRADGVTSSCLVPRLGTRPSLATHTRPVRHPRERGHAPADPGSPRRPALPALARALAHRERACGRLAGRRHPRMAGSRLQPAWAEPPPGCRAGARDGWPGDLSTLPGVGPYTAAAVRNFALGENVLPRDVNVERIERRTGHRFTGAAAQALMDLGATVCLARIPRCEQCPIAATCPSVGTQRGTDPQAVAVRGLVPAAPARLRCGWSPLSRNLSRSSMWRRSTRSSETVSSSSVTAWSHCRPEHDGSERTAPAQDEAGRRPFRLPTQPGFKRTTCDVREARHQHGSIRIDR